MSKRFRLLLVILAAAMAAAFLYPTVTWYLTVPQEQKELAASSREQVREYAQKKAVEALRWLKDQAAASADAPLPAEYSFLVAKAQENLRRLGKPDPAAWTIAATLSAFRDERDAYNALENQFHQSVMSLKELRDGAVQLGLDLSGGLSVVLEADVASLKSRLGHDPSLEETEDAMMRAVEILTNRIDQFGLVEPQIRRNGATAITVEIPGDPDPERVRSFLMGKGSLNFHIVDDDATQKLIEYQKANPGYSPTNPLFQVDFIPAGSVVRGYYQKDQYGLDRLTRYIVIKENLTEFGLTGDHIQSATVDTDQMTAKPLVLFKLDGPGGDLFYTLTEKNKGKSLAIVMDDKVKAYATIQDAIRDSVQISGFSREEASNIALILRTAALPVDLVIQTQEAVGASLGHDAIAQGVNASLLGLLLVVLFMLVYYRNAGMVSFVALVVNGFLMLAILSVFKMTLTLTSIAGFVLTIGMAVDANVIIFERIKEEYYQGKTRKAAVKAGFGKAFWAIFDSNITTIIAAFFLSQLGRGPVQGFAVSLMVGIVSSMFTALFMSRLIFDFFTEQIGLSRISIGWKKVSA